MYFDYLSKQKCVDCGEKDPVLLEPDHVRGKKKHGVGSMIRAARAWSEIEEELAKCDIRCVSCHRKKTAKDQGWYKYLNRAQA